MLQRYAIHPRIIAALVQATYGYPMLGVTRITDGAGDDFFFDATFYPCSPGCYVMKAQDGRILYVGKAVNLRRRLASYFRTSKKLHRKAAMISRIRDIEVILVRNEREALILESQLIRHLDPPYNSRFTRDDDSYYYIALTDEPFPRLIAHRKRQTNYALLHADCEVAVLFGPYTGWNVRNRILNTARRLFPLRSCPRIPKTACLRADDNTCLSPCQNGMDEQAYHRAVTQTIRFLKRPPQWRLTQWEREMGAASEALDYDRALVLRDRIRAFEHARQPQVVDRADSKDLDVLFFGDGAATVLEIRAGILLRVQGPLSVGSSMEAVESFFKNRYANQPSIRTAVNISEIRDALRDRYRVYTPSGQNTPLMQLMDIAERNHVYRLGRQ